MVNQEAVGSQYFTIEPDCVILIPAALFHTALFDDNPIFVALSNREKLHCCIPSIDGYSALSIKLNRIEKIHRTVFTRLGDNGDFGCQIVSQFGDSHRRGGQAAFVTQVRAR
jgi:hypothetical protein